MGVEEHDPGGKHRWPLPEGIRGDAAYSRDGKYRYALTRGWSDWPRPLAVFVGLNPSTAMASVDDPTIRKCWTWARSWGLNAFVMLNLYGYRATSPAELRKVDDPIGPENDRWIRRYAFAADLVIAAWGNSGDAERGREVAAIIEETGVTLNCMGVNKDFSPKHPLYLPNETLPRAWTTRP